MQALLGSPNLASPSLSAADRELFDRALQLSGSAPSDEGPSFWSEDELADEAAGDDNEISHDESFDLIDVDPTTFLKCLVDAIVFDWADLDKDRTLSFSEFLLASCVMCTLTQRQLAFFVFAYFG